MATHQTHCKVGGKAIFIEKANNPPNIVSAEIAAQFKALRFPIASGLDLKSLAIWASKLQPHVAMSTNNDRKLNNGLVVTGVRKLLLN